MLTLSSLDMHIAVNVGGAKKLRFMLICLHCRRFGSRCIDKSRFWIKTRRDVSHDARPAAVLELPHPSVYPRPKLDKQGYLSHSVAFYPSSDCKEGRQWFLCPDGGYLVGGSGPG